MVTGHQFAALITILNVVILSPILVQPLPVRYLQSEHGLATMLPLERITLNHSSFNQWLRGRGMLGSAQMPLYDDLLSKGYYTTRVSIGTPPHEFALIVDTGSTVTYVPCSSCSHCGRHQDPRFSPEASNSYQALGCGSECETGNCAGVQCKYERQYAEMSTSSGLLGKDLLSFGSNTTLGPQKLVFGCETVETGDLYSQAADGIMGLGRGPLSVIDQLVKQKVMDDSFSLCYGGMDEGGGAMVLGALPPPNGMVYTASNPHRSPYYNINLKEIQVAGHPLDVRPDVFTGGYGTVLDSGTTYAYLPEAAFTAFKNAVTREVDKLHVVDGPDPTFKDICFAGAGSDVSKLENYFPSVEFVFGHGEKATLSPENYLFRHTKVPGAYCLGIFKNGKDPTTLLGGIVVRNTLVTYDRANQKVGFWKVNCSNLWESLSPPVSPALAPSGGPQGSSHSLPVIPPLSSSSSGNYVNESIGSIEIEMSLHINLSVFNVLKEQIMGDIARELDINISQLSLAEVLDMGSNVFLHWVILPATSENRILTSTAQSIILHLENHELHLDDRYGFSSFSWKVVPVHKSHASSHWHIAAISAVIASAIIIVAIGALVFWQLSRFRDKHLNYQTIQEDTVDNEGVQLQQI